MTQGSPTGEMARDEVPKRPKGILKNSNSYQLTSPSSAPNNPPANHQNVTSPYTGAATSASPMDEIDPLSQTAPSSGSNQTSSTVHPGLHREISDKELTLANTIANAGPRRNSSTNTRGSGSRRHSSSAGAMEIDGGNNINGFEGEDGPRLKWDEANLYLAEQERGSTMRIDEPKTPWAKQYDPIDDEEEEAVAGINAQDLVVDELDKAQSSSSSAALNNNHSVARRHEPIPDLDLGEPEEPISQSPFPNDGGEKRVIVDESTVEANGPSNHGEAPVESLTTEQLQKHRQFEERRRKHYEMRNVKDMLSHPEENLDEMDEDFNGNGRPPLPTGTNPTH